MLHLTAQEFGALGFSPSSPPYAPVVNGMGLVLYALEWLRRQPVESCTRQNNRLLASRWRDALYGAARSVSADAKAVAKAEMPDALRGPLG